MKKVSASKIVALQQEVYIVMGIDENGHDQVLAVFYDFDDAKKFIIYTNFETKFYDLWVDKFPLN